MQRFPVLKSQMQPYLCTVAFGTLGLETFALTVSQQLP